MDSKITVQIVKSAAAIICTAAICATVGTSAKKWSEAEIKEAELTPAYGVAQQSTGSSGDSSGSSVSEQSENADVPTNEETTAADSGDTTDTTQAAPSGTEEKKAENKSGVPSTKSEIINYCNKALNDAKAAKVGYTKTFVRKGGDNLPKIISSVIAQNKVTTSAKGDANIKTDFPAAGFDWSSKLRESDVTSAELKPNGQYYEITLKLGKETNPGKGEKSSYGRVMSVMDESDAKSLVPGVNTVNFVYHDGYVYAKIDAKTGKLVKAEFSATADLAANVKVFGDLKANNVKSTETFTDIKW